MDTAPTPTPGVPTAHGLAVPPQPTIAPDIARRLPAAGLMFAAQSSAYREGAVVPLVVTRLTPAGLEVLGGITDVDIEDYAWLDHDTLVALESVTEDRVVSLHRLVAGKPAGPPQRLTLADWKLPPKIRIADGVEPDLHATRSGQAWLSWCVSSVVDRQGSVRCTSSRWLRVDVSPPVPSATAPTDLAPSRSSHGASDSPPDPVPALAAPASVRVELTKVRGAKGLRDAVSCTRDGVTMTLPHDLAFEYGLRPKRVVWLSADPPIFRVYGAYADPLTQEVTAGASREFRACDLDHALTMELLGGGVWAEHTTDRDVSPPAQTWMVYVGEHHVASIPGYPWGLVVAP